MDCSLKYEHIGNCLCNVKSHTCKEYCDICKEMKCGHIYNHNLYDKVKCQKCNNQFCKLSKKGHICSGQHDCQKKCDINGWCQIEDFIKQEEQIYKTQSGEDSPQAEGSVSRRGENIESGGILQETVRCPLNILGE